ncbi:hypothetical protein HMSSN036_22580 [Paenibacillus macerans]|nr:hypothetical protein HMSSN036_22580 [Paenibacillus macerans]
MNHLAKGPVRYNELRRLLPEATQRMLTMQLKMLESDGLIIRKVYPVSPPKVEYDLSELGKQLAPHAFDVMRFWHHLYRELSR